MNESQRPTDAEIDELAKRLAEKYNDVARRITKPLSYVFPDDSFVEEEEDYRQIEIALDENLNQVIVDFAEGHGTGNAIGATLAFGKRSLKVFIANLQAALDCLADVPDKE